MEDERTVLLSSGYSMPVVGLGTSQPSNEEEEEEAIVVAIDAGYRHIDTAFLYKNEAIIGRVLKKILDSGKIKREDLFIVTKLPANGLRQENVEEFCRMSLTNLQLDYVDLYLIHWPMGTQRTENDYSATPVKDGKILNDHVDLLETWHAMEKLVRKGLVHSLGLSNCNSKQIKYVYDGAEIKPTNLQVECHAYLPQLELHEFCKNLNISFTGYAPIGSPGLIEKAKRYMGVEINTVRLIDDPNLKTLCEKYNKKPAQILLRYLLQRGIMVIPKSTNPQRICENIDVFDFNLSDDEICQMKSWEKIDRLFKFDYRNGMKDHPEYPFNIPY